MKKIEINNRFILGEKLGKGSFGIVYRGIDKLNGNNVAIKLEPVKEYDLLSHENNVYSQINDPAFKTPKIYWYGTKGEFRVLVMDGLGVSLESLFQIHHCHFSLKTTLMIGIQICDHLEHIHRKKYIHRDLKPENFVVGLNENKRYIYILDYGLSKRYKNDQNVHTSLKTDKKLVGTSRYASTNSHEGFDLSRRDDLESLFYILVYFYKGCLPWQGAPGKTREEKYANTARQKLAISLESLCKDIPEEFYHFIKYIKTLNFKEKPNYKYVKSLLFNVMKNKHYIFDYNYDWTT